MHTKNELNLLEISLDIAMASDSLASLCRQSVLSPKVNGQIRGSHVFLLDQHINLVPTAFFGADLTHENPPVALTAITTSALAYEPASAKTPALVAVPFIRNGVPEGCCVLILKDGADASGLSAEIGTLIGKVCGYFLGNQTNPTRAMQTFSGQPSIETLTSRQIQILDFMAEGLTNVEISRKLLLSESTIRQESVRIYRILGTDNRHDAVSNGRSAGLIAKLVMHDAAIAS